MSYHFREQEQVEKYEVKQSCKKQEMESRNVERVLKSVADRNGSGSKDQKNVWFG